MHERIVIYPKGKVGDDVCYILGFVGYDKSQIIFIDDACGMSLEKYKKIKKNNDLVLIASKKYFLELSQKLGRFDIKHEDGLLFASQKLDEFFGKIAPPHKTVGVITNGPSGSKHRGNIESILKSNGIQVVFFCCSEKERLDANDRRE